MPFYIERSAGLSLSDLLICNIPGKAPRLPSCVGHRLLQPRDASVLCPPRARLALSQPLSTATHCLGTTTLTLNRCHCPTVQAPTSRRYSPIPACPPARRPPAQHHERCTPAQRPCTPAQRPGGAAPRRRPGHLLRRCRTFRPAARGARTGAGRFSGGGHGGCHTGGSHRLCAREGGCCWPLALLGAASLAFWFCTVRPAAPASSTCKPTLPGPCTHRLHPRAADFSSPSCSCTTSVFWLWEERACGGRRSSRGPLRRTCVFTLLEALGLAALMPLPPPSPLAAPPCRLIRSPAAHRFPFLPAHL